MNCAPRLGVFAKQPLPGAVKTRLCPPLSAASAAAFYEQCLHETLERMRAAGIPLVVFYAGEADYFRRAFPGVALCPQRGEGLGARIRNAFDHLFGLDASPCALIGSDSPDLPPSLVRQALERLAGLDALSIPAGDGGYVLIGLKNRCPSLFETIPWSTPGVLEATRSRAAKLGIAHRELACWEDVDDIAGLRALVRRSPEGPSSRFALEHLGDLLNL